MKKLTALWLCCFFVFACQSTNDNRQENDVNSNENEKISLTYRSDGFYNGITSEYLQTIWNNTEIEEIWYWNTEDENKQNLKIASITYSKSEIDSTAGELSFPSEPKIKYHFVILENTLTLTHDDERKQEYEYDEYE